MPKPRTPKALTKDDIVGIFPPVVSPFTEEEGRELWQRYAIPASGGILWGSVLANFQPGHQDIWVDYHNDARAPLLFISGAEDHLMPPSVQRSNAKHYRSKARTEVREFPGRAHLLPAQDGWEEVADYALDWAVKHAVLPRRARPGRGVPILERAQEPLDTRLGAMLRVPPEPGLRLPAQVPPQLFRVTHIGGPTALLEVGAWTLLTDPTFDSPGRRYGFGWGTGSRKLEGPAIPVGALPPIDVVLLSHEHHADNLDDAGRSLLADVPTVVTTSSGATRLSNGAIGLKPWDALRLDRAGRDPIEIVATPGRHGPPGSRPFVGAVLGFALRWQGQRHGAVWISGDTVLFAGVREAARRLEVGTALLHLGSVRFGLTGPIRYTMSAREAVELSHLMRPRTVIPVHYTGWGHFRQGRRTVERSFAKADPDVRDSLTWLTPGTPTEVSA